MQKNRIFFEKSNISNSLYLTICNKENCFKFRFSDHKLPKYFEAERREILKYFYLNEKLLSKIVILSNKTIIKFLLDYFNIMNLNWNYLILENKKREFFSEIRRNNNYYFNILKSLFVEYFNKDDEGEKEKFKNILLEKFNDYIKENNRIIEINS